MENGKYVFEIQRKYPAVKGLLEERLMSYSLGKQVYQSVNEGFEIIEDAGIYGLENPDFRVFWGNGCKRDYYWNKVMSNN
ncbi:MAG TPA: hypothetical protein VN414_03755 [Methanosarcina sp.]|nr:hypothetical protein [Methanosarcina sp.]